MFLLSFHDVSRPDSVLHQCLVEIAVAHMVETVQTQFFKCSFILAFSFGQLGRWSCTRDVSSALVQISFFKFSRNFARSAREKIDSKVERLKAHENSTIFSKSFEHPFFEFF